jgi:fatty acid desaturase
MLLLTLLVYGIYSEVKNQTYDPDTNEAMLNLVIKSLGIIFFWPFMVISLASKLKTPRQQATWSLSTFFIALLSFLGGIGLYLVLGIILSAVTGIGYLYYVHKIHRESQESELTVLNEDWE